MKKLVSLFLCVTLVFSIFAILPVNTFAATSDFSYEVLADGTAALKKYEGSDANVKIPATIAGYTISSIGDYAFCFYQDLKNVEIPETVTSIGAEAFSGCYKLKTIDMPDGVTSIGDSAFYFCGFEKLVLPDSLKSIGDYAFSECTSLTQVTLPENIKTIGEGAFSGCNLKSITIPAGVIEIGSGAFNTYYIYFDKKGNPLYKDFVIKSNGGTKAETYAKESNLPFVNLDKNTTLTLKKSSASVYLKGTAQISATVVNGYGKTTYVTSNSKVATVNSKGKVTAKKAGAAKITVTNNGASKIFTVTVKNPVLNKKTVTLKKGGKFQLKITGKIGTAKFTSSNSKIANVSTKGKITAKSKGTAVVNVKTNGITLKCKVIVK